MSHPLPSPRIRARRLHDKASHDRAVIDAILDAMPVAHVGHIVDGFPVVTPTLQWREGDRIYWHGASASRMQHRPCHRPPVDPAPTLPPACPCPTTRKPVASADPIRIARR